MLCRCAPGRLLQARLLFFLLLKMSHHLHHFLILCQWTDNWQRKPRTEIFSAHPGYDLEVSDLFLSWEQYLPVGAGKCLTSIKISFFVLMATAFNYPQECLRPKSAWYLRLRPSKYDTWAVTYTAIKFHKFEISQILLLWDFTSGPQYKATIFLLNYIYHVIL